MLLKMQHITSRQYKILNKNSNNFLGVFSGSGLSRRRGVLIPIRLFYQIHWEENRNAKKI